MVLLCCGPLPLRVWSACACRFLTNLPEGMLQLNKRLLQSPANPLESGHFCKQNEEQIQEVCEAALTPSEKANGAAY